MKHAAVKLMLISFFVGFGVFFGLDVARHGIEQVNGPLTSVPADAEQTPAPSPDVQPAVTEQPQPAPRRGSDGNPSLVEQGTDGVGRAFQWMAKQCMHVVGNLYDAVLG